MKIDIYRYIYSWFSYWTWWFSRAMFIGSWFMESPEVPNKRAGDWILIPQWQCFCSPSFIYLYVKTQNFRILWSVTYFLSAKNSQGVSTCKIPRYFAGHGPMVLPGFHFPHCSPCANVELPQDGGNAQVIDLRLGAPGEKSGDHTRSVFVFFTCDGGWYLHLLYNIHIWYIFLYIYIYTTYIYIYV